MPVPRWFALLCTLPLGACGSPATPKVDLAAEEHAIRQLTDSLTAAQVRRDEETVVNAYAPGVVIHVAGRPPMVGREALRKILRELFSQPVVEQVVRGHTVVVSSAGDLAYEIGPVNAVMQTATGKTEIPGKSILIYRKIGGQWKVVASSYSTDSGAAPLPAAPALAR